VVTNVNPLTITMNSNKTIVATFQTDTSALQIQFVQILPNGNVQFTVIGPTASSVAIEALVDFGLEMWMPIETITPFTGTYVFEDLETATRAMRFDRAVLTP